MVYVYTYYCKLSNAVLFTKRKNHKQFSFWLKMQTVVLNKNFTHTFEPKVGQMFVQFFFGKHFSYLSHV